jgi:transposase-like protein
MNTKEVKPGAPRRRRRHDAEFKARVIEACLKPGVSVAAIALANGLNANFVRGWVKAHREGTALTTVTASPADAGLPTTLVPLSVTAPTAAELPDIRIEIRRSQTTVQLAWPVSQASALGHWLKDLLK